MKRRPHMGGLWERIFGKKKTGLPVPAREEPRLPGVPRGFEIFAPKEKRGLPSTFAAFAPKESTEIIPKTFEAFAPAPSERTRETHEEKEAKEMALWKDLFPQSQKEEKDIFEAFKPQAPIERPAVVEREPYWPPPNPFSPKEVAAAWRRTWPDVADYTSGRMPLWVMVDYEWTMPPTTQVVDAIKAYVDLNVVFEQVLVFVDSHDWEVAHMQPGQGYVRYEIDALTPEQLFSIMGLPQDLLEGYGYQPLAEESFWEEVLMPWFFRFSKAMDILKPRVLHGSFALEAGAPSPGGFTFFYEEPLRES